MTSNQLSKKVDLLLERVCRIEAKVNLIDKHLVNELSVLAKKVAASERQLYAMYVVGGVHLMLMGFVLKHVFD